MSGIFAATMIALGLLLALGLVIIEGRRATRTTCRVCGCRIRPGGVGCAQLGSGFCAPCMTQILRGDS